MEEVLGTRLGSLKELVILGWSPLGLQDLETIYFMYWVSKEVSSSCCSIFEPSENESIGNQASPLQHSLDMD